MKDLSQRCYHLGYRLLSFLYKPSQNKKMKKFQDINPAHLERIRQDGAYWREFSESSDS